MQHKTKYQDLFKVNLTSLLRTRQMKPWQPKGHTDQSNHRTSQALAPDNEPPPPPNNNNYTTLSQAMTSRKRNAQTPDFAIETSLNDAENKKRSR